MTGKVTPLLLIKEAFESTGKHLLHRASSLLLVNHKAASCVKHSSNVTADLCSDRLPFPLGSKSSQPLGVTTQKYYKVSKQICIRECWADTEHHEGMSSMQESFPTKATTVHAAQEKLRWGYRAARG